jgi:hypothetical protein
MSLLSSNRRRLALASAAACLAALGTAVGGAPPASSATSAASSSVVLPAAPIGHAGRWITDATGRVLLVTGVNMVNKLAPYTPAADGFHDADDAFPGSQWLRRGPDRCALGSARTGTRSVQRQLPGRMLGGPRRVAEANTAPRTRPGTVLAAGTRTRHNRVLGDKTRRPAGSDRAARPRTDPRSCSIVTVEVTEASGPRFHGSRQEGTGPRKS